MLYPRLTAAAIIVTLSGCSSYRAKPIDPHAELVSMLHRDAEIAVITTPVTADRGATTINLSDGLNDTELVAIALTLNPELRAKRAALGEAEAALITAGLWPNPTVVPDWKVNDSPALLLRFSL